MVIAMIDTTRNILRGMGSILDIMPVRELPDFSRCLPKGTPEERMTETWTRVGNSIRAAMEQYGRQIPRQK